MNGITTAQNISDQLHIPVILLTAYSDTKNLDQAKIVKPYGYIVKPFKDQDLLCNLDMALYKHKRRETAGGKT
jgi:AmiR/NasT family two-component response regulator|tara:strand:+ start:235 stop:453 length:219 start_codon:yes stop_codon:yes gene_type:complete